MWMLRRFNVDGSSVAATDDYGSRRGWERHINENEVVVGLALSYVVENAVGGIECRHVSCYDGVNFISVRLSNLGQLFTHLSAQ